MFRTILVPLDGSPLAETALPHAATLAEAFGAALRLLRIVPTRQRGGAAPLDIIDRRLGQVEARAYLDTLVSELRARGLQADSEVTEGQPADRILEVMRTNPPDLLAVTTHGAGGCSQFRLSGTVYKVISQAGTSVLLVPTRGDTTLATSHGYRRVLVATACSRRGEWALATGAALARATGAELVVLHVVPVPETAGGTPLSAEQRELVDRLVRLNREHAEAWLSDTAAKLDGPDLAVRTRLEVSRRVAHTLVDVAEAEEADLVLLGAHGASTSAQWLYGAIAMQVLAEARRPLLIVQDAPRRLEEQRVAVYGRRRERTLHHQ